METLFVLLYWPVVGLLILFASRALLRKGVGPWWNLLLISVPLWVLSMVVFGSVIEHLHGRLLQILYGQGVSAFHHFLYGLLYTLWVVVCLNLSLEPVGRRIREERRRKKAAEAKPAGME
ncbi:MAG: hypothetical protein ACLQM6_07375 [Acidobacteriaceae bacterium]